MNARAFSVATVFLIAGVAARAQAEGVPAAPTDLRAENDPAPRAVADVERPPLPPPANWTQFVRFSGFVQTDWVISAQDSQDEIDGSTGAPLNEKRFLLRRGHLRADIDNGGYVFGSLEIDANTVNGPLVRPIDAEASIRWPRPDADRLEPPIFMTTIGLMKTPFGFEVPELDNVRPFLERSAVMRALFPGEFDLGLRFKVRWRGLDLALGLMNGDPIGERQFPGRDPSESKDMVGRLGATAKLTDRIGIEGGISAVTGSGFHTGTPATKDTLVWRDTNEDGIVQVTEIQVIAGSSATPSQNFHRFAIGADARAHALLPVVGELALRAELVWATNLDRGIVIADPVSAGHDLREVGWYVGVTQELTRWGMVGVRYDFYNPDADANRQQGPTLVPSDASFTTLAFMGMLRYAPGRLILEYDHNTNPLGRAANGAPTTLKDDTLTLRGEVSF